MAKHGKKYRASLAKVDRQRRYPIDEALALLKTICTAKFNETVDLVVRLGVDPRKSDEMVRGAVSLPHGTGKTVRVLVFAEGDKAQEAQAAGADFVGSEDIVEKIKGGWMDFDAVIATPDMMKHVGKLGRVLGPRGLMPNPKVGTVTPDIAVRVKELKAGRVEFRVDKAANVHTIVGKASFGPDQLKDNILTMVEALQKAKPSAAKGTYIRSWAVSTTMSPGIKMDINQITELLRARV